MIERLQYELKRIEFDKILNNFNKNPNKWGLSKIQDRDKNSVVFERQTTIGFGESCHKMHIKFFVDKTVTVELEHRPVTLYRTEHIANIEGGELFQETVKEFMDEYVEGIRKQAMSVIDQE